jgi:hypothetical protein
VFIPAKPKPVSSGSGMYGTFLSLDVPHLNRSRKEYETANDGYRDGVNQILSGV